MAFVDPPNLPFPFLNFATIVSIIPTVIFFIIFLWNYFRTRQQMFAFLAVTFMISIIQNFLAIRQVTLANPATAELFFIIAQMFKMFTLYFLLIVVEMFERNTAYSGRLTILTGIMAATVGAAITTISSPSPAVNYETFGDIIYVWFPARSTVRLLEGAFGLVAGLWLLIVLYRSWKRARSPKQKRLIVLILIGLFFCEILGSALPVVVDQFTIPDQVVLFALGGIEFSSNIGMFIIGYAFYRASRQPWLLQRQKVHLLLVYSKEGLDLYSKIFSDEMTPEDVTLLTGGFTAVTSMFQEATKTGDKVQSIQFEGRTLRLFNREFCVSALLVDYTTQASELALQKFTEEFEKKFDSELRNFSGNVSPFEKASSIADQYFS